jgi:hypothetical protein
MNGSGSTTGRSNWSAARRPSGIIIFSPRAATGCSSWVSGPIALALCGASDPASQKRIDAMLAEHGPEDFAARFLERRRPRLGRRPARRIPESPSPPRSRNDAYPHPQEPDRDGARPRHRRLAAMGWSPSAAHAQITVFDPSNYSQNMLTAARTLQQINNQIQSLQNEAQMLLNQART